MPSDAEQLLEKLRKLKANRSCADCGVENRFGFESVCVKYSIFVCGNCKSAHQAYSHRVKHIRMSTWTLDEVEALRKKRKGGNEYGRAVWYAKMTPEQAEKMIPKPGDHLNKHKELIVAVYENKRFYDESNYKSKKSKQQAPPVPEREPEVAQTPPSSSDPGFDLLDFGGAQSQTPAPVPAPAPAAPKQEELFFLKSPAAPAQGLGQTGASANTVADDLFNLSFDAQPAPAAQPAPLATQNGGGDLLGSFDMMGTPTAAPQSTTMPSFQPQGNSTQDPFAVLQHPPQRVAQQQFINAMAHATGDPFAGLHMKRAPVPMKQAGRGGMPQMNGGGMPQMNGGGIPPMNRGGMPQMNGTQPPMMQSTAPQTFGGFSEDPFAGLQ